ncbi:hypothetical protein COCNU_scaffold019397G000010 [Cocos nucifera]|nr:hypothetical protein [Cocos nucifera]
MAVPSSSSANSGNNEGARRKRGASSLSTSASTAAASKRTKNPGVRVVGGRIYDSEHGKTCHQCRQKTRDFAAACKQMKKDKLCTIKFCHNCLRNRKKRGQQPTGILVHAAKATGFSSVSHLLQKKGFEVLNAANVIRTLKGGGDKENYYVQQKDADGGDNEQELRVKKEKKNRLKKLKRDTGGENTTGCGEAVVSQGKENLQGKEFIEYSNSALEKEVLLDGDERQACNNGDDTKLPVNGNVSESKDKPLPKARKFRKHGMKKLCKHTVEETVLPEGTPLTKVGDVEFPVEDVGDALQFLEFCKAFSKVLDIKKGQAKAILRELTRGRVGRHAANSLIVQFHIKLLSLIQKNKGEKPLSYSTKSGESWMRTLKTCITGSQCPVKKFPLDCLNNDLLGYDSLDPSKKLRVLNFLCDESLGTEELRHRIDKENSNYIERNKAAKEKVQAAKRKEKDLKKKLKDDVAKTMLSLKGAPLSLSEHGDLISTIKAETEKIHAEMLESMELVPKSMFYTTCHLPFALFDC